MDATQKIPATKKEAFDQLLEMMDEKLSNAGCNDFVVHNTQEMYAAIEQAGADNVGMTLDKFRKDKELYEDYGPSVSEDKKTIFTQDFVILGLLRKELRIK